MLRSGLCTEEQLTSEVFANWADQIRPAWDLDHSGRRVPLHRKVWEWIFIIQALHERGLLAPGKRGLGFGVGTEPLAAIFASLGCEIVATDLDANRAQEAGWVNTGQHASAVQHLNASQLCDPDAFEERVSFRVVNMNRIPRDLHGFDFCWSSCAFEHLGSIAHGQDFVLSSMRPLVPGGVAVHTTEFNVSSNQKTVNYDHTVLYRRRDVEWLIQALRTEGAKVDIDYDPGTAHSDRHVDVPPFTNTHLKIRIGNYVTTSLGLIAEKTESPGFLLVKPQFRPIHLTTRALATPVRRARVAKPHVVGQLRRVLRRCIRGR